MSVEIYKSDQQEAVKPLFDAKDVAEAEAVKTELNNDTVAKLVGLAEKGGRYLAELGRKFLGPKEISEASGEFRKEVGPGVDKAAHQDGNVPEDVLQRFNEAMNSEDEGAVSPQDFLSRLESASA